MIASKEGTGQSKPSPVHTTTYRIVDNVFLDDVARFSAIACSVVISGVLPLLGCNIDAVLEDIARSNGDARGAAAPTLQPATNYWPRRSRVGAFLFPRTP